jgi:hypothetical protein
MSSLLFEKKVLALSYYLKMPRSYLSAIDSTHYISIANLSPK